MSKVKEFNAKPTVITRKADKSNVNVTMKKFDKVINLNKKVSNSSMFETI